MNFDRIQKIIRVYDSPNIEISSAYEDGGLDPLWPRLQRAAINQSENGLATFSRYGIWANTVRDNILDAITLLESGRIHDAKPLLVRSANAMSAFSEIQYLIDKHD